MGGLLVSVVAAAVVLAPGSLGDKKPKPGEPPSVPWGMCSVLNVVVKSQQHPCPDD